MPLKRIDVIIAAALVVAATASAIGVVTYDDDRVGAFLVSWSSLESEVDIDALSLTGGGDVEATTNVTLLNLTKTAWIVTVAGSAARVQPVAIHVTIVSPTNLSVEKDATLPVGPTASVDVSLDMELATIPTIDRITGPSLDSARNALNATLSSTLGVGTWTIRVSIAPTAPGPLGGTESFTIAPSATLTAYTAELTTDTPEVTRG